MNREEAENYIYQSYLQAERYRTYEAKDAEKRSPALSRPVVQALCQTPAVVVTGSKGKGSVANMVSQILRTRFTVGLLTSPHLIDFCERVRVNGEPISDADFISHISRIRPAFEAVERTLLPGQCISPMGIQAALALSYFNARHTQFNVFECGKGARFDDVNNVTHDFAIINSIFLEHTRELGQTVEEIAADKAHVITPGLRCVYVAPQTTGAMQVIRHRADMLGVPLKVYGKDFRCERVLYTRQGMQFDVVTGDTVYRDLTVPLLGEHQARNCALAMALCHDVAGTLPLADVRARLASLIWPGRMQIVSVQPFILLDACIHAASTEQVLATLQFLHIREYTLVAGIPDDKDFAGVVRSMRPHAAHILLTRSQNPHYRFTDYQQQTLAAEGIKTTLTRSVPEAMQTALSYGLPVVILGTTSVVAEVVMKTSASL